MLWRFLSIMMGIVCFVSGSYLASWAEHANWFEGGYWYDTAHAIFFGLFLILLMACTIVSIVFSIFGCKKHINGMA